MTYEQGQLNGNIQLVNRDHKNGTLPTAVNTEKLSV